MHFRERSCYKVLMTISQLVGFLNRQGPPKVSGAILVWGPCGLHSDAQRPERGTAAFVHVFKSEFLGFCSGLDPFGAPIKT